MVAVVSGSGLGLFNTGGAHGDAQVGRGRDRVFVNTTTGNLVVQALDDKLVGLGADLNIVRTYNSQGHLDDDNGDNWRLGIHQRVYGWTGTLNTPGSTVKRVYGDGAEVEFGYDAGRDLYVSTDGSGAHDTLKWDATSSRWIATDDSAQSIDEFDSTGKLVATRDMMWNITNYIYSGNRLIQVTDASGQQTHLDYDGAGNLTHIRVISSNQTQILTRYGYDGSNRLQTVTLDLSPTDGSVADGNTYTTTYTYEGTSRRILSITQKDGSSVSFTYQLINGDYRVRTYTDGEGRTSTIEYSGGTAGGQPTTLPASAGEISTIAPQINPTNYPLNGSLLTTPPPAGWAGAAVRETSGTATDDPKIVFDAAGNGLLIRRTGNNIQAQRYTRASNSWGPEVTLDSRTNNTFAPSLSVDFATGNAVAAWVQSNGTANSVYAARFDVVTGNWSSATLIDIAPAGATFPVNTATGTLVTSMWGNRAAIAWLHNQATSGTNYNLYVARFNGTSWLAPQLVESRTNTVAQPSIAIDADGNIAVAFQQSDGTANSIYVNRFNIGSGTWTGAALRESSGTATDDPRIAFDAAGNGILIRRTGNNVQAQRYVRATNTWLAEVTLDTRSNNTFATALAVDPSGNAVAAWVQSDGTANSVYAARFNAATGSWLPPTLLDVAPAGASFPANTAANTLVVTMRGTRAAVAWQHNQATTGSVYNLYVARFDGTSWLAPQLAESQTANAAQPSIDIDAMGNVAVAFQQNASGVASVYVNRYNIASTPYFVVRQNDTWQSIAATLYGIDTAAAGAALSVLMPGQTLEANNTLVNFPAQLPIATDYLLNTAPLTSQPLGFGTATPLSSGGEIVVKSDSRGNAFVLQQSSGGSWYGRRYDASTNQWSDRVQIDSHPAPWEQGAVVSMSLNVDDNGNALATWMQRSSTDTAAYTVYARFFDATTGTVSAATAIHSSTGVHAGPVASAFSGGRAAIAFQYQTSPQTAGRVHVARFEGGAWTSPELVSGITTLWPQLSISVDGSGDIQLTDSNNGSDGTTYTIRDAVTGQWSLLDTLDQSGVLLAYDAQGNAIALSSSPQSVEVRHFDASTDSWSQRITLAPFDVNEFPYYTRSLAMDSAGNAVVAWYVSNYSSTNNSIRYARYDRASNSWSQAYTLAPLPNGHNPGQIRVAINGQAIAISFWVSGVNADSRFVGTAGALTDLSTTVYGQSWASLDAFGNAMIVSLDVNGTVARRYLRSETPYYTVPAGATWPSIAQAMYGTATVANELQAALRNPPLTTGNRLFGFPPVLNDTVMVATAPNVIVQAGDSWGSIAARVYGTDDANAIAALITFAGNPALVAGARINVPANLQFVPVGEPVGTLYTTADVYDSQNRRTTYVTDADGRLASVTRPSVNGAVLGTAYTYDADGNVSSVTEDAGGTPRITNFIYDSRGNLRISRDSLGDTLVRTFNSSNLLLTETRYTAPDPDGSGPADASNPQTTRYIYDQLNRLGYIISAEGRVTYFDYQGSYEVKVARQVVYATLFTGNDYRFNSMGGWAGTNSGNPANEVTHFYYDFRGNLLLKTRAATITSYGWASDPKSNTGYLYDQRGLLRESVEARGAPIGGPSGPAHKTSYLYDGLGRLQSTTQWMERQIINGSPVDITRTTVHSYDDVNRRTSTTFANGLVTTTVYNRAGETLNVLNGVAPNGSTLGSTSFAYDSAGQLRIATDPAGLRQFFFYDAAGRKLGQVDGDGSVTEFFHDGRDKQIQAIRYAVRLNTTQLAALADGAGNPTAVSFSTVRDQADDIPADDRITRDVYDGAGRLVFSLDETGAVTRFIYDGAHQPVEAIRYRNTVDVPRGFALTDSSLTQPGSPYYVAPHENDRHTRNFFDKDGLLIATLDGDGYLSENTYDGGRHLVRQTKFANQADVAVRGDTLVNIKNAIGTDDELAIDGERDATQYFFYDSQGRLIGELDPEGHFTESVYDLAGHKVQSVRYSAVIAYGASADSFAEMKALASGSASHATLFEYDGTGRLVRQTNFEGTVTTFDYDVVDNVTGTTEALGASEERGRATRYDLLGRATQELSGEGVEALEGVTDPGTIESIWNNHGVRYSYDLGGRRVSATSRPDGVAQTTYFYYDRDGRLQFELDALGRVKENVYDTFGQLSQHIEYHRAVSIAGPQGGLANDTLAGNLRAGADATLDSVTNYSYTARGQVRRTTTVEGATTTTEYNTFGEVQSQRAGSAFTPTVYTYDHRGYRDQTLKDGVVFEDRKYDAFGRLCTIVDARGNTSKIEYDRLGRTVVTEAADGSTRQVSYDAFSRVTSTTDALQNVTSYSYDESNRRVTVLTPENVSIVTEHTRLGQTFRISQAGNTTEYRYDDDGRLLEVLDSAGTREEHGFDSAGREVSVRDATGTETRFGYDAGNRRISKTVDPTGLNLVTTYTYDPNARQLDVLEPGGRQTRTEFDRDGRVKFITVDPNGAQRTRTEYRHDDANNVVLVIEGQLASADTHLRYTRNVYDALGRLVEKVVDPADLGGAGALNLTTQYRYDNAGNVTRRIDAEQYSTWFVYDSRNRIIETIDALGGVTSMKYDAEGRVIETRRHATAVTAPPNSTDQAAEQQVAATARDRVTRSFYDADGRERFTVATLSATVSGTNVVERGVVTERTFDAHGLATQTRVYRNDIEIPANANTAGIAALVSASGDDRIASALYDDRGRAVFTIDVYRGITRNWYDQADQLIRTTTYAAPPDGSIELTIAGLEAWSEARAANSAQNALDHTQAFWYDSLGRVRFALDAAGYLKETRYLDATREVIDYSYAQVQASAMDAYSSFATVLASAAASVDTAHDRATTTLRDAAGRVEKVTQVVDYQFDGVASPTSSFEQYTYDGVGNKRSYRNANGDVWTYDYDANGRLSAEFSPEIQVTTVEASGNDLLRSQESVSVVTRITYDNLGNVETRTEGIRRAVSTGVENHAGSRTTTYGYDALGRQTSVTHPQVMVYSAPSNDAQNVDVNDQLKETLVTPVATTTYNTLGDAITNVDVSGAVSRKAYDDLGRLRFEVDALGYVTEYTFDNFGNAVELTRHGVALGASAITGEWTAAAIDAAVGYDDSGRTIVTEYDRLNRRTRVTQPSFTSYTPDATGLVPGTYVHAFAENQYEYDAFGQLTRERKLLDQEAATYADTWFVYDNVGRRRYSVDALRYVTDDQYDAFGNLTLHDEYAKAISGTGPWTLASVLAALDATLPDEAHPDGIDRKTTYEYDSLGRLRRQDIHGVEFKSGSGADTATAFGTQLTQFEYDAVGNRTKVTDHYGAVTFTYYDVMGRIRAIVEPPRNADTNGDYFTESGITPMTEMHRNVYGDLVEQIRYGSNPALDGNGEHVAPTGGAVQRLRMLLDNHGQVKRSQDGTLAPDGSLSTKFFSYNLRGDVAKEWQIFTDVSNTKFVQSVIRQYDAAGRETLAIQPQLRSDTVPLAPTSFERERGAGWLVTGETGQWIYDNKVNAHWDTSGLSGEVRVYLFYTRMLPGGTQGGDTETRFMEVDGASGSAEFVWTDVNRFPPDLPANGGIWSIQRIEVYARNAQNQFTILLRSSDGNPPGPVTNNAQVAYVQTRYNGFGEVIARGVNAAPVADHVALQEYWKYDDAGHVWATNADGVDRVFLHDVAGRVTAEIRHQQDNFIRNLTDASGAYFAPDRMMTETLYNALGQATMQRTPTFGIDERLESAATSVSISLVNGRPFLQWAGTLDPSLKTTFQYRLFGVDWLSLEVVQVSPGMLGVDVTDLARANEVVWNFQIVKSLSLQFAPFAVSTGRFHVLLGETVTFGIESTDNPRVATPVIGPGAPLGPTSFGVERSAAWYVTGDSGQWIYDNKVNAYWDPSGLSGTVRVYLFYTRVLAGGNAVGDTETRFVDVGGASGYADFTWTDPNRFPPDNPANGSISSVQRIEVYAQNAQGQYTVLLRSSAQSSPPGPVRLRWDAPPANLFANPVFYYKRSDAATWSNGITPTLSAGKLEVDINSLLVDDTVYDYRIEYWQQNTGILLARKEGQIDSTGRQDNASITGTLISDPLTNVFDSFVPVADVAGLNLSWSDPGAAVDEIEFRWGVPGSGTYPNLVNVSRSGGLASVYVGNLPPSTDYAYEVTYKISGRVVSQQQNEFHLSAPQSTSTRSATIALTPDAAPQPAQPVATISGSSGTLGMTWAVQNSAQYIHPNPQQQSFGIWVGPNRVKPTWTSTGSTPVKVYVYYQMKWQDGSPGPVHQWAASSTLTSDPASDFVVSWDTASDASFGGILQVGNVWQIEYTQVWSVDGSGNQLSLLRDSRSSGTVAPPTISWNAPADTSLSAKIFYGLGLSQSMDLTPSGGVYTVNVAGWGAGTKNFEVHYYRPNDQNSVSLAIGQFVYDGVSVTLTGAQQNIVRDPQWIGAGSSGNNITWSKAPSPANSQIYFQYYDGSWQSLPMPVTADGTNYTVDLRQLPDGTYNNVMYRVMYYTPGGMTPYAVGTGRFNATVSTSTSTPTPVLTRDLTPSFNQKYPTQPIGGVERSGNQITWSFQKQAGDRVFLRYQINNGTTVELEQFGSGPAFAVTIPELGTDGTKQINWWVEYRSGSPGSARAFANGHGTLTVLTNTTYPTTTLLSANDVYPTAIYLPPPYQVGGAYSNVLRWDTNPEADAIVEFRLTNAQGTVLVNTLSADRHQIDLSGYSGAYTYELTFRRPSQSLPYARVSGPINIGRTPAYIEMPAALNQVPVQPESTPYMKLKLDRWGNVLEQTDGAVFTKLNEISGAMDVLDVPRLKTQYSYNVFGQLVTVTNESVGVVDSRGEMDATREIPVVSQTVTSTSYYDMLGRQVATRDENGNVNSVTLNLAGQIIGELHADLGTKSFMYDAFGRQIQVQDEIGWRVRSIYDAVNRQIGVQTEWAPELWLSREFTYDELGRRIAETSGEAADGGGEETTQYFYDLAGNLIRRRSELGYSTTYTYDLEGHKTSERDAIGGLMRFEFDHFGNLLHKWDLANERTDYDYNGAGLLDSATSTRSNLLPNQMDYEYDGAGHLTAIIDNATNRRVDYGYDTWGRMRRERTVVDGVLHQDTQSTFDNMNRLAKIVDLRYSLEYYYDAHGNRSVIVSKYLDHVHALHTDNLWYTYDEMNRVKLSEGTRKLVDGLYESPDFTTDSGTYSEYHENGQRAFTDQYGKGVLHFEGGSYSYLYGYYRESYEYDGAGRLHAIWHTGAGNFNAQVEVREYDGASRQVRSEQRRVNQSNTHFFYDDDGRMTQQVVRQGISDEGAKTSQTDFNNDAASVQRSYKTTTFIANGLMKDEYWYVNQYRLADGYLLSRQDVTLTQRNAQGNNPNTFNGTVERIYDVNNNVVKMRDSNAADGREFRYLANNLQGEVMTAIETDATDNNVVRQAMKTAVEGNANLNFAQHFFHAQGQSVGSLGQLDGTVNGTPTPTQGKKARFFGIAAWGDSWAGGATRRPLPAFGATTWQPPPPPKMNANFDVNFTEIGGFQASASNVVVQEGDTLRLIASRLFGDGNLWYLLADENGFTQPDAALPTGTNLRVPNQVYSLANTAGIFKPFDPSSALGDKQATLIDPTPPPPKQPCGGHAKLILTIIAVVVTIIVAYFMGPASGPVAAFFNGLISAVAGNAVSQGVAIGMGLQDGFNWKQAAVAGISGGFGGIIAPAVGQFLPNSPIAAGFVSGAIGNAVTQGASILLDLQESFSWKDVAMSATSGAANAAIAEYAPRSFNDKPKTFLGDFGKSLVTGTTNSFVQAAFGGKIDALGVVADAFGTALGNSLVRQNSAPSSKSVARSVDNGSEAPSGIKAVGADDDLAEVLVTARARESSLSKNPEMGPAATDDPDSRRAATRTLGQAGEQAQRGNHEAGIFESPAGPITRPDGPDGMMEIVVEAKPWSPSDRWNSAGTPPWASSQSGGALLRRADANPSAQKLGAENGIPHSILKSEPTKQIHPAIVEWLKESARVRGVLGDRLENKTLLLGSDPEQWMKSRGAAPGTVFSANAPSYVLDGKVNILEGGSYYMEAGGYLKPVVSDGATEMAREQLDLYDQAGEAYAKIPVELTPHYVSPSDALTVASLFFGAGEIALAIRGATSAGRWGLASDLLGWSADALEGDLTVTKVVTDLAFMGADKFADRYGLGRGVAAALAADDFASGLALDAKPPNQSSSQLQKLEESRRHYTDEEWLIRQGISPLMLPPKPPKGP